MAIFNIWVLGYHQVGKSSFIADALDLTEIDGVVPIRQSFDVDGQRVLVQIAERSVELDPYGQESIEQAAEKWNEAPLRIDGAIVLYDVTNKRSLAAVPIMLLAYKKAGVPCLLVSTKGDCDPTTRQLNPTLIEQKARLIVDGLTAFESSVASPDGAKRCINILIQDIAHRHREEEEMMSRSQSKTSLLMPTFLEDSETPESSRNSIANCSDAAPPNVEASRPRDIDTSRQRLSRRPSSPTVPLAMSPTGTAPTTRRWGMDDEQATSGQTAQPESRSEHVHDDPKIRSLSSRAGEAQESDNMSIFTVQESTAQMVCTLDDLVDRLLRSTTPDQDEKYAYKFLTLYRMFASPLQLLDRIVKHCFAPYGEAAANEVTAVDGHVFQTLFTWIDQYPGDLALKTSNDRLIRFLDGLEDEDDEPFPAAARIRTALGRTAGIDDVYWGALTREESSSRVVKPGKRRSYSPPSSPGTSNSSVATSNDFGSDVDSKVVFQSDQGSTLMALGPSGASNSHGTAAQIPLRAQRLASSLVPDPRQPFGKPQWHVFMQQPEEAIARELTRIDWILFSSVTPRDLVRHVTVSAKERSRFPGLENVTRMVSHFNHVANWASNIILIRDKPKHRAPAYEKLVKVARRLRGLNNYSSLGAIVAGIHSTPVHRLAITRNLVSPTIQKDFMKLDILMSVQKGHFAYRMAWDNTTSARIPFLPLHLRDLIIAEQTNKTFIEGDGEQGDENSKKINWTKFDIIGGVLEEFQGAQSTPYTRFVPNEEIKNLLLKGKMLNEDQLYERSTLVEPAAAAAANAAGMHHLQTNLRKLILAPHQ